MKNLTRLVKSFQIETPVVSAMFLGYFVLLLMSAVMIYNHTQTGSPDQAELKSGSDQPGAVMHIQN